MKFIADKTVPYLKGILDSLADITYLSSEEFTPEHVRDVDALIVRSIDKCTRELLQGSRVKLITSATIGFDHIDTHYCEQAGIVWRNAPGCNARSVAQYVLAGLVARSLRLGDSLQGKTMGIVGLGHIGMKVARIAREFGMDVFASTSKHSSSLPDGIQKTTLQGLLGVSDILTLHCPLTDNTRGMINSTILKRMKRGAILINTGRGPLVNEADVAAALKGEATEVMKPTACQKPVIENYA